MTIKNTSQKVINIGTTILMPDKTMEASKALTEAPSIKAMVERGQLAIISEKGGKDKDADKAAQEKAEAEERARAEAEAKAAEEAAKAAAEGSSEEPGGDDKEEKPLSRMNKGELIEECQRLGIVVGPDDTNPTLVEKIKAATAE